MNTPEFEAFTNHWAACPNCHPRHDIYCLGGRNLWIDDQAAFIANLETLNDLENNLRQDGHKMDEFPWVIQYNKRDLPNVAPIQYLQLKLNKFNVPYFEAIATNGNGVFETLKAVINLVVANVKKKL